MGKFYVYTCAAFAAIGGILFGYDIGVISGVLDSPAFNQIFGQDGKISDVTVGVIVSILTIGCFLGSLISGWSADYLGRKQSITLGSLVFILGAGLQTGANNIGTLYAGRFIAGLAIGVLSTVVPMYQSEIAPNELRGRLVSLQQWAVTWGILISFLINYGCAFGSGDPMWRLPLGLQIIPAFILWVGSLSMPNSPRWLLEKGFEDKAYLTLAKLRDDGTMDSSKAIEEFNLIQQTINEERRVQISSYKSLFGKRYRRRVILGILIQAFQQLTGINSIMYYAPKIFDQAGLHGQQAKLLATAINGIVNVLATIPAILFVDKWGRRQTLISGAFIMGIAMMIIGILMGVYSTKTYDEQGVVQVSMFNNGASYAVIIFIYVFVAGFAFSWGPVAWIYNSEIFPLTIRSKAISIATASNWLCNYIIGQVSPILINRITFGIYIIFAAFCFIMLVSVYFFFPETKGFSLEEIESVFNNKVSKKFTLSSRNNNTYQEMK
jgi:sugar porter (SP) family MFS transporter